MGHSGHFQILLICGLRRLLVFAFVCSNSSLATFFRIVNSSNLVSHNSTIRIVGSGLPRLLFLFHSSTSAPLSVVIGGGVVRGSSIGVHSRGAWSRHLFVVRGHHKGYRTRAKGERNFSGFRIRVLVRSLHRSVRST